LHGGFLPLFYIAKNEEPRGGHIHVIKRVLKD